MWIKLNVFNNWGHNELRNGTKPFSFNKSEKIRFPNGKIYVVGIGYHRYRYSISDHGHETSGFTTVPFGIWNVNGLKTRIPLDKVDIWRPEIEPEDLEPKCPNCGEKNFNRHSKHLSSCQNCGQLVNFKC